MIDTSALPRPRSDADARDQFLKWSGDPRLLCKYLAVAVVILAVVCGALVAINYRSAQRQQEIRVVRIDESGEARTIGLTTTNYRTREPEVKYFLTRFVHMFYGMNRRTMAEDFKDALLFVNSHDATEIMEEERTSNRIAKFIAGGDDEIEIKVDNIVIENLDRQPYSAQVILEKVYRDHYGHENKREKFIDGFRFTLSGDIPNAVIPVNPLGFNIISMREDQAF